MYVVNTYVNLHGNERATISVVKQTLFSIGSASITELQSVIEQLFQHGKRVAWSAESIFANPP